MSIAQWIVLIFAFCAMAVTLFVIGAFIFNAVWLWRPRWTVWYPPDPKFGFKGAWPSALRLLDSAGLREHLQRHCLHTQSKEKTQWNEGHS